jgi:hypothetical protein
MTTALALIPTASEMDALNILSGVLSKAGYFKEARDPAKAGAKILYGRELGLGPVQSLLGIDFSEKGGLTLRAHTMAALIRSSGRYDYRIIQSDDQGCEIEFYTVEFEAQASGPKKVRTPIGRSSFTMADAKRAGLASKSTYLQHPVDMLYNRAMSKGARMHCPDVFGAPVYSEGELDGFGGAAEALRDPAVYEQPYPTEVVKAASAEANAKLRETISALGSTPETLPPSLQPDEDLLAVNFKDAADQRPSDEALPVGDFPPSEDPVASATPAERAVAAQILEDSAKIANGKATDGVISDAEYDRLTMGDIVPVALAERVYALPSEATLAPEDASDFHAYLVDFLGGGDAGKKTAKAEWAKVGVTVKKGVAVLREQAIAVARSVNTNTKGQ